MNKYLPVVLTFFIFYFTAAFSQQNIQVKDAVYHRSSITYIVEAYNGKYQRLVSSAIPRMRVPSKLDDNRLVKPVIPSIDDGLDAWEYNSRVIGELQQERIPNKIIANWFNRKPDGSFNMNLVLKRGHYDANDAAVLEALSMKRGLSAIDLTAMELVENSYILVMDIKEVHTMDEEYDMKDKAIRAYALKNKMKYVPIKRIMNGFKAVVEYRLYQINFNDSIAAIFYRNLWVNSDDPPGVKAERKKAFDNFNFPLIYQYQAVKNISGTQLNPGIPFAPVNQASDSELMIKMFENGVMGLIRDIEKVIPKFRIRANLTGTKPVEAKIGLKEGLIVDQRFYVYEDKMNKSGKIKSKRKGVVRVKRVADNRKNATGNSKSTQFYQIAGHGLATGMVVEQHRGANMGLSAGFNFIGNIKGVEFRLDYNLSSMFAGMSPEGNAMNGFKIFIDLGIDSRTYHSNSFKLYDVNRIFESTLNRDVDEIYQAKFGFLRVGLGLSKSFQLGRNIAISPELAWNYEMAISTRLKDEIGTELSLDRVVDRYSMTGSTSTDVSKNLQYNIHYIIVGAELTINIAYPFQFYGKLDIFGPLTSAFDRDNNPYSEKWHDFFSNRSGMTIGAGIRLEF